MTDMTMPTETDCGVVVAEMRACLRSSYSVVVLSTRKYDDLLDDPGIAVWLLSTEARGLEST